MTILIVIISLSILIIAHEFGHFLIAKLSGARVDEFGFGFPPRLWSKKIGGTLYSLNALPFGGFVRIYGEDGDGNISLAPDSFASKKTWQKSAIVLAGVFMNVILGWLLLSFVFMIGAPSHLAITDTAPDSPADIANIKSSDIIMRAEGGGLPAQAGETLTDPIKTNDFIAFTKKNSGNPINLKIRRHGEIFDVSLIGRVNPPAGEGSLGIGLVEIGFPKESFLGSFRRATEASISLMGQIASGFWNLLSKIFVSPSVVKTVTGPVGIFAFVAEASSLGFVYVIQLIAMISLNLAVLNLIPFPALDGGRFLFILIEKLKGSPLPKKFQGVINTVGFAFLIILMLVVTIQDIGKIIK